MLRGLLRRLGGARPAPVAPAPLEPEPEPPEPGPPGPYLPEGYVATSYADYMAHRASTLMGDVAPAAARGLEIGPLHAPIVAKSQGEVLYVDFATTEALRARYAGSDVDPGAIVEVDVVWGERALRECLPPGPPRDYVLAVHVVEHVPDLVGWLGEMRDVLREDGLLGLIVPDRRHTFDILRPESTLGEVLDAYWQRARRPSMRQVFDHQAYATEVDTGATWREPPEAMGLVREARTGALGHARALAESLRGTPEYRDSHCWLFTPESFVALAAELAALHLFPFVVEYFRPTLLDWNEFTVRLRSTADPADPRIAESLARARRTLEEDVHEHIFAERMHRAREALRSPVPPRDRAA